MDLALRTARYLFLTLLVIFLVLPLVVVAGVSLNGSAQMVFPPQAPGLRWYAEFFGNPAWTSAFQRSLLIAALAALLATATALPVAYVQWRLKSRLANILAGLGSLPFLLPSIVLAILFLLFWSVLGHVGRLENIVVSHAVTYLAVPLTMISLGFSTIDNELVESAQTMGAPDEHVFRTVILPLIAPYMISSMIFVGIFSLNEVLISYMVGGWSTETLPVKIFTSLRTGFTPAMCVAAVLFLAIGVLGFITVARLGNLPRLLGARG
ncbi:MAG TPA: ABC transporter permease subunit [Ramlibacter sp.]|jgi:putative spermidine/putrescine transport system permease protein